MPESLQQKEAFSLCFPLNVLKTERVFTVHVPSPISLRHPIAPTPPRFYLGEECQFLCQRLVAKGMAQIEAERTGRGVTRAKVVFCEAENRVTPIKRWNKTFHPPRQINTSILRATLRLSEYTVEAGSGDSKNPGSLCSVTTNMVEHLLREHALYVGERCPIERDEHHE
jgi:hypothetical protein